MRGVAEEASAVGVVIETGGRGAVREFAHWWLGCRGLLEPMRRIWLSQADSPAPPA